MHYNSIDDFLRTHEETLIGLMEVASHQVGGHYAGLSAHALHELAARDMTWTIQRVRQDYIDRQALRRDCQAQAASGVPLAELRRRAQSLETAFINYVNSHLADQGDLRRELVRRIAYVGDTYRNHIMTVELEAKLQQFARV
jgi:hypothetical protein